MPRSTAPDARRALFQLLAGAAVPAGESKLLSTVPALEGVTVVYGYLNDATQMDDEMVHVGDVEFDQDWGALGRMRREESYRVELIVFVKREGDDQHGTEDRCWDLVGAVEDLLRADVKLGGAVREAGMTRGKQSNNPDSEGWVSQMIGSITCKATI
ncbi:MAG: hypothetical protein M3340_02215 [Actinomycetota bacterium]|nr:hypothetical protein [Actinomycetota bacterium]